MAAQDGKAVDNVFWVLDEKSGQDLDVAERTLVALGSQILPTPWSNLVARTSTTISVLVSQLHLIFRATHA